MEFSIKYNFIKFIKLNLLNTKLVNKKVKPTIKKEANAKSINLNLTSF